jgi:hypothetical protein
MMHRSDYREAWEKKKTWYANLPAWGSMEEALRLHTDGNVKPAWGHLVRLVEGITGDVPI